MADPEKANELATKPVLGPGRVALRILGNASLSLPTLYVLGYIYLKTYLAFFGLDVNLASLSIVDLLLAHRHIVVLDFFVIAGALQVYLFSEVSKRKAHAEKVWVERCAAVIIVASPILITIVAVSLAYWSETGVPKGFDHTNMKHFVPMMIAWIGSVAITLNIRYLVRTRKWTYSYGATVVVCVLLVGATVAAYRLFAWQSAENRSRKDDFEQLIINTQDSLPEKSDFVPPKVIYELIYADSQNLFVQYSGKTGLVRRDKAISIELTKNVKRLPAIPSGKLNNF